MLEYKFFEPAFYHTDVPDWGTSYVQVASLGDRAMVCLDTGHLLIGGGDPVRVAREHPERIAHMHLKDVDLAWARKVQDGSASYTEAVAAGMYVALGAGDVRATRAATGLMVRWGVWGGVVLGAAVLALAPVLPAMFTPDPAVRSAIAAALVVVAVTLLVSLSLVVFLGAVAAGRYAARDRDTGWARDERVDMSADGRPS